MELKFALTILEDWGEVLAVDKPAGWLSIPGRGHKEHVPIVSHVLGEQLRMNSQDAVRGKNPDLYVVHRLDEGTSGVMIFAKTAVAHKNLGALFEHHKVKKTYRCLVMGNPSNQTINAPLFKIPSKKIKSVVSLQGKPSETKIRVLKNFEKFSLVEAQPLTGRSHQIRVHLAHIGCPLVGDVLYGGPQEIKNVPLRFPLLHCHEIEFEWPQGEIKKALAPRPEEFTKVLKSLGYLEV